MVIELTLAPFNDCFVGVGASGKTPEYELDNVEFICDAISMGQDYLAVFGEQLATNGIDMSFSSYRSHHTSLQAGQQTIQISQNSKSCKGVYTIIRGKDTYHSNYVDSLSTYKSGNLIDYQYNLGSKLYPEFKVNTSSSRWGCVALGTKTDLVGAQHCAAFKVPRLLPSAHTFEDPKHATSALDKYVWGSSTP